MKYLKFLFAILFLIFNVSCKKSFLNDVNDRSRLLQYDYITDLKTTREYLNGIYTNLGVGQFRGYHVIYPDLIADNIKPVIGSNGRTALGTHYSWSQQADESANNASGIPESGFNCNGFSYVGYQIIRSANFVLEKTEEYKSQDPVSADAMKGQAYAIRALTHFMLVNFFAQSYNFTTDAAHPGVAYVTTANWTDPVKGRNAVSEVYANMISDLNNAIPLLPTGSSGTLTINKNAAIALLARVYLFKGDWVQAKNLARRISTDVPIMITNYPSKLFTLQETEALFQIPPAISTTNQYSTNFASFYFRSTVQFVATSDIAALLNEDPNDVRKSWVMPNLNIVKFPTGIVPEITNAANSYYQTVIRSSEMYLTAAEAYAQLNNVDSARFYLDAIRKRANPAALASTAIGTALLEAIYKERRKELAFEGFRMFDLLRWKRGVSRLDALSATAKDLPYPSNKAVAPISTLDVNVSGFIQNVGY